MCMRKKIFLLIATFSLVGMIVSAFAIGNHYSTSKGVCNISEQINCDIVNRSIYSEIFGIPVALLGLIWYVGMFLASLRAWYGKRLIEPLEMILFAASVFGFLFSLYLTYIELYVLYTICLLCVTSQAMTFGILAASAWEYKRSRREA